MNKDQIESPFFLGRHASLKRSVFLLFGGFTLCLCLLFTALCLVAAYIIEDAIMERILESEAVYLRSAQQSERRNPQPRSQSITLYLQTNGEFDLPEEIRTQLDSTPAAREIFTPADDTHYHLKAITFADGQEALLVANVSAYLVVTTISKNVAVPVVLILACVFSFSLLIAYRIAARAVSPVEQLSKEVHSQQLLSEKDIEQRMQAVSFNTSSLENEIGFLSRSLEQAFNQLASALNRESHFTRDLSHEMRTPLTIIKNSLALLEQRSSHSDQALKQIQTASVAMDQTVEVLLALARKHSLSTEVFDLRQLIEEEVLELHLTHPNFKVEMDLQEPLPIEANRRLCSLLIHNLLENAARYSDNDQLLISLHDDALVFSNAALHAFGADSTNPGVKRGDSEGIGQGLYLVKRIVDTLGWRHDISGTQGYYRFRLFPVIRLSR